MANAMLAGIKYLFQTANPLTFCISCSGHAGMEAAFSNLVEDGDVVLVVVAGLWGERASDMSRRLGGDVREIRVKPGETLTAVEARKHLEQHRPAVFFIAHGESSTGALQSLNRLGGLCRQFDCLFVVDAVITLGCVPFHADRWLIDVAYTGSQKVLNAAPGITPITFSLRAL